MRKANRIWAWIIVGVVAACVAVLPMDEANAATSKTIACGQDIDALVNSDPQATATRFVLQADCAQPFTVSATLNMKDGDEMVCATPPTFGLLYLTDGIEAAYDPSVSCGVVGTATLSNVFHPTGRVYLEGFSCRGGNYTGTGTGSCLAMGQASPNSDAYGLVIGETEAVGISNAHGVFRRVELYRNTTNPNALGITGSGIKGVDEFVIQHSYIHGQQGNGIWCDNDCNDQTIFTSATGQVTKFQASFNAVVGGDREGIRYENVGTGASSGEAQIDYNLVSGNGLAGNRYGVGVRDAQNALITKNTFGSWTIGNTTYPKNGLGAVRASDSGRADRPNLSGVSITSNALHGETLKGCELPDSIVACGGNG